MDFKKIKNDLISRKERLKEYEVAIVYFFGSQKEGVETKLSDLDLGIVFRDNSFLKNAKNVRKNYASLYDFFSQLLSYVRKEIDIVFLQQTSPVFQYQVVSTGEIIYEESTEFRANYEEYVVGKYLDFKPLLDYSHKSIVERTT